MERVIDVLQNRSQNLRRRFWIAAHIGQCLIGVYADGVLAPFFSGLNDTVAAASRDAEHNIRALVIEGIRDLFAFSWVAPRIVAAYES